MNPAQLMTNTEARKLLGTLSEHEADIASAFRHRYQQTLQNLSADSADEVRTALELQLQQLSYACRLLLGRQSEAAPQAVTAEPAPVASPASDSKAAAGHTPPRNRAETTQAPLRWLLTSAIVTLVALILTTGGLFLHHLTQQISTLESVLNRQTDQLVQMQQMHLGERRQWLAQLNMQQSELQNQQQELKQSAQQLTQIHQQLASTDKQLALAQYSNRSQQEQIARLSRVSEQLIVSLCEDSSTVLPAISLSMRDGYMQRCQQSWRLAAQ